MKNRLPRMYNWRRLLGGVYFLAVGIIYANSSPLLGDTGFSQTFQIEEKHATSRSVENSLITTSTALPSDVYLKINGDGPVSVYYRTDSLDLTGQDELHLPDTANTSGSFTGSFTESTWEGTKNTFGNYYFLSAIGASFVLDRSVRNFVVMEWSKPVFSERKEDFTTAINRVEPVGANPFIVGGLLYGLAVNNQTALNMSLSTAKATFAANGAHLIINKATTRKSPLYTNDPYEFEPFDPKNSSIFPSGHVLHVAPMVGVVTTYMNDTYVDAAGYTLIGLMSAQRINKNVHWLSDTVVSGFLGFQIGKSFALYDMAHPTFGIQPLIGTDSFGIQIGIRF